MATPDKPLTPDLIAFGYRSERGNHLDNLRRELDAAARALAAARKAADEGRADTSALRNLTHAAAEARERGGALAALDQVDFMLPAEETP